MGCRVAALNELPASERRLSGLQALTAALSASISQADVSEVIVTHASLLMDAGSVAVALITPDGGSLEMIGMVGYSPEARRTWMRFPLEPPTPLSDAVASGESVIISTEEERARRYPQIPKLEGRTIAAIPVRDRMRDRIIGGLGFRFDDHRRLDAAEIGLLATLGELCGQALDRARLFEEADAERRRLETLMRQLPVGVAIAEAPSGDIVAVNEKATEIWRTPPADARITDVSGYRAFHADGRPFRQSDWPIERSLATGEVVDAEELEVEFGDGDRGWVSISSRPILGEAGETVGAVTTLVDVTARRRSETEARFLADATDVLSASLDPDDTLRRLAELAVPALADRCAVYMRDGDRIRTVAVADRTPGAIEAAADDAVDRAATAIASGTSHLHAIGSTHAMAVPLRARGETLGALVLVSHRGSRRYTETDLSFAVDFATHAALAVDNARLFREQSEIADTLQRSLLPFRMPAVDGFEIATRYRPAGPRNQVGGDFYDLWEISPDLFGLAIGDVCGKGARAAALTALARHTTRTASLALADHGPAAVLEMLNLAILKRSSPGNFCTAAHALIERTSAGAEVVIAVGGHPRPMVIRADGSVDHPGQGGTLLGAFAEIETHEYPISLGPGDSLVLWTDGVTERRNGADLFGEERLGALLARLAGVDAERIANSILEAVMGFAEVEPQDDIALMVLQTTR
jgi:serine phosphatase RsbU (regulator of sigma subunit)/PAS domain-containing protein